MHLILPLYASFDFATLSMKDLDMKEMKLLISFAFSVMRLN